MTATEILKTALNLGINLSVIGDKLIVQPSQLLTCELRDAIKACKSELIHLLKFHSKRAVIRFKLVNGQTGTMLGELEDTSETLIDVLKQKFGERLESAEV